MSPIKLREVIVGGTRDSLLQQIVTGPHRLASDEPSPIGGAAGADAGPTPYDLLLAALGSCTSMTLALYARRKQWPLDDIRITLRHAKIHASDCETCETKEGLLDRIEMDIELAGRLTDEQRARLLEIAAKCPVHRTLRSEVDICAQLSA